MNNLKHYNFNLLIPFIISLIIPLLIWGPFFPDLIISISGLIFLFCEIKNKNYYFFLNKPLIFFFPFVYTVFF